MLALVVIMVLSGFAIPNIITSLNNMRLRAAASEFSALVQRARITAVRQNATYTMAFGLPTGNGTYVYASSGSSTYSSSDEMVQFGGNVKQVAAPAGALGLVDQAARTTTEVQDPLPRLRRRLCVTYRLLGHLEVERAIPCRQAMGETIHGHQGMM